MVVAINECVLPIISYAFGVTNWLEGELKQMDIDIRKMLHLYKIIQIKTDVDRLYGQRHNGGRGLISVWDSYKSSMVRISHVINEADSEVLNACCKLDMGKLFSLGGKAKKFETDANIEYPKGFHDKSVMRQAKTKAALIRKAILENRKEKWQEKPQHGAFLRQLGEIGADMKESFG